MSETKLSVNSKLSEAFFKYVMYFAIFGAMVARGAFFTSWLLILNVVFLLVIILRKNVVVVDLRFAFLLALAIIAVLSLLNKGTNLGVALQEIPKYTLFPISYLVFFSLNDKTIVERILYRSIIFLAIAGLLAMTGMSFVPNMVIEETRRLQSFLQYANTTATLLGAGIFLAIEIYIKTRNMVHIISGSLMLIALIMTQSRIGFWVFIAILAYYVFAQLPRINRKYLFAALGLAVIFMAVFGYRLIQISLFEPTLIERILTYQDAIRMLKSNFFGIGMGAWQFKQFVFQSAPYYVRFIHSVYFQIALDCGIIGLLCFVAVIIITVLKGFSNKNVYYFIFLLIAVGSVLEVNFAFGIIIVCFTFALVNINAHSISINVHATIRAAMVVLTVMCISLLISNSLIMLGKYSRNEPEYAVAITEKALIFNPWNYEVYREMAKLEKDDNKAIGYLLEGNKRNPEIRIFLLDITAGYYYIGNYMDALKYARELFAIHKYSWETRNLYQMSLEQAYKSDAITKEEYNEELNKFCDLISIADDAINPLYQHMQP